ncbi:MAG: mevalonate kinase [Anaerolineales bacterium]|jgi:mevalonate kinase
MTLASACGKIILLGEHAVVYGRPGVAVPLSQIRASAQVAPLAGEPDGRVRIQAPDLDFDVWLHEAEPDHPLARIVALTLQAIPTKKFPALKLDLSSEIPIAAGLGSGAAISVAIVRALSQHLGHPIPAQVQSDLAFEVEKIHHGTPSGIDNTVVAFEQPVYYQTASGAQPFSIGKAFTLVIGNTGRASPTSVAVARVREAWQADPRRYEALFEDIGQLASQARQAIEKGETQALGPLMNQNQVLLAHLGVSAPELDNLIQAAQHAGAQGAKLSGAGLGGSMIALVEPADAEQLKAALRQAGATEVLKAEVGP